MRFIALNEKGMSLIEIMVAMVLFSVGILSLGMFIPYSTKKLVNASARTTSVTIAQSLIDEVMQQPVQREHHRDLHLGRGGQRQRSADFL
jgi:prepilin-type N-terminal cleavage/methylation domain-containing protein